MSLRDSLPFERSNQFARFNCLISINQFDSLSTFEQSNWSDIFDFSTHSQWFHWKCWTHISTFLNQAIPLAGRTWLIWAHHWTINFDWFLYNLNHFPELFQNPETIPIQENFEFAPKLVSIQYFAPILSVSDLFSYISQYLMPSFYVRNFAGTDLPILVD